MDIKTMDGGMTSNCPNHIMTCRLIISSLTEKVLMCFPAHMLFNTLCLIYHDNVTFEPIDIYDPP